MFPTATRPFGGCGGWHRRTTIDTPRDGARKVKSPCLDHGSAHPAEGEDGATLVPVTLTLFAMFGLMVLVVDVGSLLYARRALVNSADAAALAAAQSCGVEGAGEARVQAELYAVANHNDAVVVPGFPTFFPSCDAPASSSPSGSARTKALFFAPVLGADAKTARDDRGKGLVGRGRDRGRGRPADALRQPVEPRSDPSGPSDRKRRHGVRVLVEQLKRRRPLRRPTSRTRNGAHLSLLNWDIMPPEHCNNSTPPQFEEWMLEGFDLPLPIDSQLYGAIEGDGHTYIHRGQGNFGASLDHDIEAAAAAGDAIYFPVNRPTTQIDANGDVCAPEDFATTNCAVDKYDVIGFARLFIVAIHRGNQSEALTACAHVPGIQRDANARCMIARWEGYTQDGLDGGGGENFGLVPSPTR